MPNCLERPRHDTAARCAVCNGKFGLIRYYSWRTPFCSKACVDRFRSRRESDRSWLSWLQTGVDGLPGYRARVL
jgi:hypothetical protein